MILFYLIVAVVACVFLYIFYCEGDKYDCESEDRKLDSKGMRMIIRKIYQGLMSWFKPACLLLFLLMPAILTFVWGSHKRKDLNEIYGISDDTVDRFTNTFDIMLIFSAVFFITGLVIIHYLDKKKKD